MLFIIASPICANLKFIFMEDIKVIKLSGIKKASFTSYERSALLLFDLFVSNDVVARIIASGLQVELIIHFLLP